MSTKIFQNILTNPPNIFRKGGTLKYFLSYLMVKDQGQYYSLKGGEFIFR